MVIINFLFRDIIDRHGFLIELYHVSRSTSADVYFLKKAYSCVCVCVCVSECVCVCGGGGGGGQEL